MLLYKDRESWNVFGISCEETHYPQPRTAELKDLADHIYGNIVLHTSLLCTQQLRTDAVFFFLHESLKRHGSGA